jgi:hypothetical protein
VLSVFAQRPTLPDTGLASPVGADQAEHLSLTHGQQKIGQGGKAAVPLVELMDVERGITRNGTVSAGRDYYQR